MYRKESLSKVLKHILDIDTNTLFNRAADPIGVNRIQSARKKDPNSELSVKKTGTRSDPKKANRIQIRSNFDMKEFTLNYFFRHA